MSLRSFSEYKKSGIEWMGQVPIHWENKKVSELFEQRNEKVSDKDFEPLSVTKLGILKQLENVAKTDNNDNRKKVLRNDFVINSRSDRKGSCGVSNYDGSVSLICTVIKPKTNNTFMDYYHYVFRNKMFSEEFYRWGRGIVADLWSTRWDEFKKILIPFPPLEEQKAIAHFLNHTNEIIEKLIFDKKQQVETLQQFRQSLITELVTHGLNKSAKMKDCEIEWISEIPDHWEVVPLFSKMNKKLVRNTGNKIKNVLSLSYGNVVRRDIESNFGLFPESFETYQIVEKGELVLRLTDLQNDKKSLRVGLVKEKGIITSAYLCLKLIKDLIPEYAYFLLHTYDLFKVFYGQGGGVRQALKFEELKRLPIIIPPINEQQDIVKKINDETGSVEENIKELKEQIIVLNEYRQSLIYEAVTGKIDVRNYNEIELEVKL